MIDRRETRADTSSEGNPSIPSVVTAPTRKEYRRFITRPSSVMLNPVVESHTVKFSAESETHTRYNTTALVSDISQVNVTEPSLTRASTLTGTGPASG